MKKFIKEFAQFSLDTLFDEELTCNCCGKEVFHAETLCADCEKMLTPIGEAFCERCGRQTYNPVSECKDCKGYEADMARSVFVYGGTAAKLIKKLKYRSAKYLGAILAKYLFVSFVENKMTADILTYVPMTEKEEFLRGYNHSELLCRELSALTGIPVKKLVTKCKATKTQVGLNLSERKKNLKGSFAVADKKQVKGKKILIIDDVLTTGATSGELAALLKKAGAESVSLLTLASVSSTVKRRQDEDEVT